MDGHLDPTPDPAPDSATSAERELEELRREVARLGERLDTERPTRSRRQLLRLGGAAAVGAVAAAVGSSGTSEAAATLTLDSLTNRTTLPTGITLTGQNRVFGLGVLDNDRLDLVNARIPTGAVLGHAAGVGFNTALVGHATDTASLGVYAQGPSAGVYAVSTAGYGVMASGASGAVLLLGRRDVAAPPTERDIAGVLDVDGQGTLWFCVADGPPPQWRRLAAPGSDGAFSSIDPVRVYDSRLPTPNQGALGGGASRVVSVASARNPTTGAISVADVVPDGARSIALNLTITDTVGAGYLAVAPGNATSSPSSSINWSATGQTLANGLIAKIHTDRTVRIFSGGGGSTHVVIDVNGYWR